jgi:AAA family ATP:ADP antiporter
MALQASMAAVVCIACVAIMLQQHITNQAEAEAAAIRHRHQHRHNSMHSSIASGADLTRAGSPAVDALSPSSLSSPPPLQQQQPKKEKPKTSLKDSFRMLAASVEIRCLATMSLAQGLCNSLMEFAWKCHMRILYPSPADFTAFLGECGLQSL